MYTEEVEAIPQKRFGGDCLMSLATCVDNIPYVRTVNAHYDRGCFYVITHALSAKMVQIGRNPTAALSGDWFTCHAEAVNLGWFDKEENRKIAERLKAAFSRWIGNGHNNFDDPNTIILQLTITDGLLLSHGRRFVL